MVEFCKLQSCRRHYLLEYFGEDMKTRSCQGCDVCSSLENDWEKEEYDGTEISQMILSAVIRSGERFGTGHVINVLRGKAVKQVRSWQHESLSVFGIARRKNAEDLKSAIEELLDLGVLHKRGGGLPTISVSLIGRAFLKKGGKLALTRLKKSRDQAGASAVAGAPRVIKRMGATHQQTRDLIKQRLSIHEVANARGIKVRTAINHVEELITAGADLNIGYLMPARDRMAAIRGAFQKTEGSLLAPVKDILGPEFTYDEIHMVKVGMRQEGYFDLENPKINDA